ncbi:MAG: sigma 54-interacting transcriptional regulator [Salibacteraceae bacterium]|jgi:magnesium chelatase subunit I|nr:sigma 54-interacting transcriptional regulator [Salibacteraceae bacterium]MDP4845541.1 sigma 54-interacting transcriptional regulator [Salibacteraceae bacterium]
MDLVKTLGELKKLGYTPKSIKEELRSNLIDALKAGENKFAGVLGYDDTVIPELQRAILAKHNINLLGLRGQAKTSIARMMVNLLDEYIPAIEGTELNDDPMAPISFQGRQMVAEMGDKTPLIWIHRSERYTEKLATPDVSVADLIGDLDPIKAANMKLSYNDERVIHFGLIPRANRGIFVINELPDLQPRIQVALFNILQEGDIQIRGFKMRLPLDVQFVFTANPEDYTNRGSIITPLKDRIQSQIITHYPESLEIAKSITLQEAALTTSQKEQIEVLPLIQNLLEEIAFVARDSEFIDQKSGVSARLSISAYECLVASAERRAILNNETKTSARIADLMGVVPAITGKVELVYEGEQEGAIQVAHNLVRQAIRKEFIKTFPNPERLSRKEAKSPYQDIIDWFAANQLDLDNDALNEEYEVELSQIKPLMDMVKDCSDAETKAEKVLMAEFVLHSLSEYSLISKKSFHGKTNFNDILGSMLG